MWFRRSKKMWVATVDENGRHLGDGHWVKIPPPDKFSSDGFAQIQSYVSRLVRSSARAASLMITAPDHRMAVSILQRGRVLEFSLIVQRDSEPGREDAIRQFFATHGLSPSSDYLAGNGGVPEAVRCLGYSLPQDERFITDIASDLLCKIYSLRKEDGLHFTYQEQHEGV